MKSHTFTMKATVSFDIGAEVIMSTAGHVSRAMLSHHSPTSGWRRSGAPSTRPQRPGCSQQEARGGSRTARTTAACAAGGVHALQETAGGLPVGVVWMVGVSQIAAYTTSDPWQWRCPRRWQR